MARNSDSMDTAQRELGMQQLLHKLKSDRLIKIFIGKETTPILVQETVLRHASDYFGKAINNAERLGSGASDELHFPKDEPETWEILLSWIVNRGLGRAGDGGEDDSENEPGRAIHLCRAWVAADKYLMPALQNNIMSELLRIYTFVTGSWDTVKEVLFSTAPDSGLRRLYAEEIICRIRADVLTLTELDALDGVTGLAKSLLSAGWSDGKGGKLTKARDIRPPRRTQDYMVNES